MPVHAIVVQLGRGRARAGGVTRERWPRTRARGPFNYFLFSFFAFVRMSLNGRRSLLHCAQSVYCTAAAGLALEFADCSGSGCLLFISLMDCRLFLVNDPSNHSSIYVYTPCFSTEKKSLARDYAIITTRRYFITVMHNNYNQHSSIILYRSRPSANFHVDL